MPLKTLEALPSRGEYEQLPGGLGILAEQLVPLDPEGEQEALAFRQELDNPLNDELAALSPEELDSRFTRFKNMASKIVKKVVDSIPTPVKAKKGGGASYAKCKCCNTWAKHGTCQTGITW